MGYDRSVNSIDPTPTVPQYMRQIEQSDSKSTFGLNDRDTSSERLQSIRDLQQRVTQNHGFEAKKATRDALAENTVIRNTDPRRGQVVDISV